MNATVNKTDTAVEALRSSPINGIKPIFDNPEFVDLDKLELDPTNPGSVTTSLRYKRREPSIRDSYDIIGAIVYPIIACEHPEQEKRNDGLYIVVDGHGRLDQARRRGETRIKVIIYPPLDLEQRICLRETLGAAQEPFDAVSVIADLKLLAAQRNLNIEDADDVKVLIRDLPEKVRRREKDLITLARWDTEAAKKLGEGSGVDGNTFGIDKVKALTGIVDAVKKSHPAVYESLGRDQGLTKKLAKMYLDRKFSQGTRSQEAIRRVKSGISELPQNDAMVRRFFREELSHDAMAPFARVKSGVKDIASACQALVQLLLAADASDLSPDDLRMLKRTNLQIAATLEEAGTARDE